MPGPVHAPAGAHRPARIRIRRASGLAGGLSRRGHGLCLPWPWGGAPVRDRLAAPGLSAATPLGPELEPRGAVKERRGRKIAAVVEILALGQVSVRGEVVAAPMPENTGAADGPVVKGGSGN